MYRDWVSLSIAVHDREAETRSVLSRLPAPAGQAVVAAVVRGLAPTLGIAAAPQPSPLAAAAEVDWCMQVICHGLSLPLSEHDTIRDCVNIYCEWLTALLPAPKLCVPAPVQRRANQYSRRMLCHLQNLFVPRADQSVDTVNRQAVLCHRVLRTVQRLARQAPALEPDTWSTLLLFLLTANDSLLSPPTVKDDIGDQMYERVLGVLFEVWIQACCKCFPPPPLWKTFRESCLHWRHRAGLVDQWSAVLTALTGRLLETLYGPPAPATAPAPAEEEALLPGDMPPEAVAQTWYRLLHTLGNPVELSSAAAVSGGQQFLQYAISSHQVVEPHQHPCLARLPAIFHRAVRAVSMLVTAFLEGGGPAAAGRAKCNSVLHLLGGWLFEAALVGTSLHGAARRSQGQSKRASAAYLDSRKSSTSSQTPEPAELPAAVTADKFERGRAEAVAALCRIFCAKQTAEKILPSYLASFYLVLHEVLSDREGTEVSPSLAAALLSCGRLLQLDLDGARCLLPALTAALQHVLAAPRPLPVRDSEVSGAALRRAAVSLLVSMLALPLHFQGLPVREPAGAGERPALTFLQLLPRLTHLLLTGLQQETDPANCQTMLGGLLMCVQDGALYEEACPAPAQLSSAAPDSLSASSDVSLPEEAADEQPVTDSARDLYGRAICLVCQRLLGGWQAELGTSLAALELLAGLARIRLRRQDAVESKRAVRWLCDYIGHQCSRPPPAHSKDLHSTIVAAVRCVSVWLLEHPRLLRDADTLATLLQVVELGISGSKSQARYGEPPVMKHEKQLKPASLRVREAAEALLYVLMEQVDHFPCASGVWSLSSHLTEGSLLHHCQPAGGQARRHHPLAHFKYFVTESLLIALLEQPLGNDEDPQPTVTCLMRGPSLRTAWMLQLRHLPRHRSGARPAGAANPGRPVPSTEPPAPATAPPAFFPDTVDRIPSCRADRSIPPLESLIQDQKAASEHNQMLHLMEQQAASEAGAARRSPAGLRLDTECVPPPASQEFQTARLFLSQFQLLDDWPPPEAGTLAEAATRQQLVALDPLVPGFAADLAALDAATFRTCDTVHLYYVRSGRPDAASVLAAGAAQAAAEGPFSELLLSLGWPVEVSQHPGWTGRPETSFNTAQHDTDWERQQPERGRLPAVYDGQHWVLYWADALSEVAFVVPSGPAQRPMSRGPPEPVLVVWLESFDDHRAFPAAELGPGTDPAGHHIIFIHALQNSLYRVHLQGPAGRTGFASPLVEGLVVGRRSLAQLVRQTALNCGTRRRLENENWHPPHVRRKQKIQEMLAKYRVASSPPEFYTSLFSGDTPLR